MNAIAVARSAAVAFAVLGTIAVAAHTLGVFLLAIACLVLALTARGRPALQSMVPSRRVRNGIAIAFGTILLLAIIQRIGVGGTGRGLSFEFSSVALAALILGVGGGTAVFLWLWLWSMLERDPAPWKRHTYNAALGVFLAAPIFAFFIAYANRENPASEVDDLTANVVVPLAMVWSLSVALLLPYVGYVPPSSALPIHAPPKARTPTAEPAAPLPLAPSQVYRETFAALLTEGPVGPGGRRALDALAKALGLSAAEARSLEQETLSAMTPRTDG